VTTNLYYLKMESHSPRIGYSIRPQIYMIYYQEPGRDTVVVLRTDKIHHGFWELRAKMQREAERIANHTAAAATVAAAPAPSA
jgi:RNase P protein component